MRTVVTIAVLIVSTTCLVLCQQTAPAPLAATSQASGSASASQDADQHTAKQKLLDDEAQRLVALAIELKAEVDKTNKNILSLEVVRRAEQIEALAHKMKDQGKR